ncbi:MAG: hypothetical protein QOH52_1211 [Pseudonocardiales bacterium]|jgi:hypothetical protein|nr:hypothetical protein [Pseudonocardiales bacterium]
MIIQSNNATEPYEITVDVPVHDHVRVSFTDLALCL